jgi:hypothetical protein
MGSNTTARAQEAAFQIARISPALLVHSRRRPQHIQRPAPSHIPPHAPSLPRGSLRYVASCHRGMILNQPAKIFRPNLSSRDKAPSGSRSKPLRQAVGGG